MARDLTSNRGDFARLREVGLERHTEEPDVGKPLVRF